MDVIPRKNIKDDSEKLLYRLTERRKKTWYHLDNNMEWSFRELVIALLLEILRAAKNHTTYKGDKK